MAFSMRGHQASAAPRRAADGTSIRRPRPLNIAQPQAPSVTHQVHDTFGLPLVESPNSHVELQQDGTYSLKKEYHKGLNPFEKAKLAKDPHAMMFYNKSALQKLIETPMDELTSKEQQDDVDIRLKWLGFFHRRKITPGRFFMRTKMPNGIMSSKQLRVLADIVAMHPDDGCGDITTRQNWQLRGMTKEDIPLILKKLASVGLTCMQSGMDNVRNTVGSPISGIDPEVIIDTLPICQEIDRYLTNEGKSNPEITNLPRKWNVTVVGTHDLFEHPHINDLAFMPATKDGVMGFNVLVGGFFSAVRCAEAIPMDAWVPVDHVVAMVHAQLTAFRDFGARANRQKTRIMWLIEEMGTQAWFEEIRRRMPGGQLQRAGTDLVDASRPRRSLYGVHPQAQPGLNFCGLHVPVGRLEAEDMYALADLCDSYGDATLRLTVEQNCIVSGIPDAKVEAFLAEPLLQRFSPAPGRVMAGLVACTGNQFCGFSNIASKKEGVRVAEHLECTFDFPRDLRLHLTGCPNTCGQIQVGDIGLLGTQVKNPNGPGKVPAVDIYAGGRIGHDSHLAEVWRAGVRVEDELLLALEELVEERFGAVRRPTPLPNLQRFKQLKKKSHELVSKAPATAPSHVCLDCGYLFVPEGTAFEAMPSDFSCPGCGAAKSRFRPIDDGPPAAKAATPARAYDGPVALDPSKAIMLTLIKKESISHDTRKFRFALPSERHVLGLPTGQHVTLSFVDAVTGETVSRPYTPTSSNRDLGHVDFCIKVYKAGVDPRFPAGGKMSQYLDSIKEGDLVRFKGPSGRITYQGAGVFAVKDYSTGAVAARPAATAVGMVAGGTGITPMLQVAAEMLAAKEDIEIRMLVANQSEADILMRPELEAMQVRHPNVKVFFTLDRPPSGWRQGSGYITEEMLKAHMPAAGTGTQILLCGPPPMIERACLPNLAKLGYGPESILTF